VPSRLIDSCFPPINCKPRHPLRELLYKLFTPLATPLNSLQSIKMVRRSFPFFYNLPFISSVHSRVNTSWRHPARPPLLLYLLSPPTVSLPGSTRARCTFTRLFHLFPNLSFNFAPQLPSHRSLAHPPSVLVRLHFSHNARPTPATPPKRFDPLTLFHLSIDSTITLPHYECSLSSLHSQTISVPLENLGTPSQTSRIL